MAKYDDHEANEVSDNELASRRDFLLATKKWSKIVIGGLLLGGALGLRTDDAEAASWINRRGGSGSGAWINGGGGGWYNRGGSWVNGGGGGWYNRHGGGGAGWVNRGSSGGWVNRRGGGGAGWLNRR